MAKRGKVYIIGAGPGQAELITLRGLAALKEADVVLYDRLAPQRLLDHVRPGAKLINVGKSSEEHLAEQEAINSILVKEARSGKTVARLKGGDPFIFGRGSEEALFLAGSGIPFEVIPGVSAANAAAASTLIPLTHRGVASSVAFITGHPKRKKEDIQVVNADTLVYFMGVMNLPVIVEKIVESGRPPRTAAAVIENASTPYEKTIVGTLADIVSKAQEAKVTPPALLIVGEVVNLRRSMVQSEEPRVLFTGTHPERFSHLWRVVHQPMIEIVPLRDYSQADSAIQKMEKFDWIIFTSRYAVKYFFERLGVNALDARAFAGKKVAAIGKETRRHLGDFGITPDLTPAEETSEGIVRSLGREKLKGKKILIPRSALAKDELPTKLREMGAEVDARTFYENRLPPNTRPLNLSEIEIIVFTSPSAVHNFLTVYGSIPKGKRCLCIGKVTLKAAESRGIQAEVMENALP